jgi:hypothetical protein
MRFVAIGIGSAVAVVAVLLVIIFSGVLVPKSGPLDTTTRSFEVAGFYARGDFTGELLQSDVIQTNITNGNMSQSVQFKGAICPRVQGLGRVFLDGSRTTEPDAYYRVVVNGVEQFRHNMELGSSTVITACLPLTQFDYVISGQTIGSVKVELGVYVFDFARGAGAYEVLAVDQAKLT